MFISATGIDSGSNDYGVGTNAASQALQALQAKDPAAKPSLAIVFASVKYNQEMILQSIQSVIGTDVQIVGASTAGEITSNGPSPRESVVVMLLASDTLGFHTHVVNAFDADSTKAGEDLATGLKEKAGEPMSLALIFGDGLRGNTSAALRGMVSVLGENFPIAGGSAGDDGLFQVTYQYHNDKVYTDAIVGVGITGPLEFSVGINHGWSPVGAPRTVTKSSGSTINMIDDKEAISLYKDYLGEEEMKNITSTTLGDVALSYPLGMIDEKSGEMLLRAPFSVDEEGSILCLGEVPNGSRVQLMMGTKEDAVKAAEKAANSAQSELNKEAAAALVFSCHVRNTLFATKEAAKAETEAIQNVIGANVPVAGFYTYGEQAPVSGVTHNIKKCNPDFHNETVVLVLLAEAS